MVEHLNRLAMFVVLCLVQVLILNHVHLFGVATSLLYVYFVITFRRHTPQWLILLWSFVLGLVIDIFSSTPGLAAGSLTLLGFVQPYLLELLVPRDSVDDLKSSAATLGPVKFYSLCGALVLLYCVVYFALDAFNFFDPLMWLERVVASWILTLVMILAIETIRSK